jgi:hypothetical protein
MPQQSNGKLMAVFQQIFAAGCVLMTKICIFLFFSNLASKFSELLIRTICFFTNRIQREFLFNVAIATSGDFLASKHPRQKTNFSKRGVGNTNLFKRTLIQMSPYGHLRRAVTSRRRHRPRAVRAKKQTFPNENSLSLRSGERVGVWGLRLRCLLLRAAALCFCPLLLAEC